MCTHKSLGKRELIALLNLSSCCLVMVERLFLAVTRGCLQFVIVVFPDHTHYFFSAKTLEIIFISDYQAHGLLLQMLSMTFWTHVLILCI